MPDVSFVCAAQHDAVMQYITAVAGKEGVMAGLNMRLEYVNKHPYYTQKVWLCAWRACAVKLYLSPWT